MHAEAQFDHDDDATVFRDVIMLALLGFVTIVILLLPHLNPPVNATESIPRAGNVVVEVRWPDNLDTDIDLWVQAPGDVPVGYSNSREQAQQLQSAMRQANANGSSVQVRRLPESTQDPDQSVFYAEPQPALPSKTPISG